MLPKLGRQSRAFNPKIPHLSAHLAQGVVDAPPEKVDWTKGLPADLGFMLNNKINDCSCAAYYHALQVWSFNAKGTTETEPDSNVEALYCAISGWKPDGDLPGPVVNEQEALTYLVKTGAPVGEGGKAVHKLAAFLEIDYRNIDDVKHAIDQCGIAYIGIGIPAYIHTSPLPAVWDVQDQNNEVLGGHAVILAGYDAQWVKFISSGKVYTMSWAFFSKYTDEAYALADATWITAKGTSPGGLTLEALEQQMQALKG